MNLPFQFRHRLLNPPFNRSILILLLAILFVLLVGIACNQPGSDDTLKQTQIALNVQATQLAMQQEQPEENPQPDQPEVADQQATLNAQASQTASAATLMAQNVQATVAAQQATEAAMTANAPTNTPTPTLSPTPSPTPSLTPEAPTDEPPPPPPPTAENPNTADFDTMLQNSKILLFEDITSEFLPRYVKDALDTMGLDRNYTDVKDAVGHLKTQLLSGTDWDLIIVAVEARTNVQGEFFTYINDQLNSGTAVIIEHWNLDDLAGGKAATILTRCGIKINDWWDPPNTARSLWPLYGDHPIWNEPNQGMSLSNYSLYWFGDAGDLMKVVPGSDAELLAGVYAQTKDSYATLATCMEGRLILQTFSSHDYHREDVVRLWQNYIYNALKAHYEYSQ